MHIHKLRASEREALDYLLAMIRELKQMADASRFPMIAYFLEMAYIETADVIRGERPVRPAKPAIQSSKVPNPSEVGSAYAKLEAAR